MTAIEAPPRTLEQRQTALQKANEVRVRRKHLKRTIKDGDFDLLLDTLLNPPWWVETMQVFDLLLAKPKFGRVKVHKTLASTKVSPSKTVGGLSQRQRWELIDAITR